MLTQRNPKSVKLFAKETENSEDSSVKANKPINRNQKVLEKIFATFATFGIATQSLDHHNDHANANPSPWP